MNVSLGVRVYVKFRIFGVTLGTLDRSFTASLGSSGAIGFATVSGPPAIGLTTLLDERGVLLQVWA